MTLRKACFGTSRRPTPFLAITLGIVAAGLLSVPAAFSQTLTTLAYFSGANGASPYFGTLMADANGNLFGTTEYGGKYGDGTVFEMTKTATGYAAPAVLVSFDYVNGYGPNGALVADASGNLFGTTVYGGASADSTNLGYGTVFEIPKTATGYASTPVTLVSFNNNDGAYPYEGLAIDTNGNLFGTTLNGGQPNDGTVFEIAKTASGYSNSPSTLVTFNGGNGSLPLGALMIDPTGNLFGTTETGGQFNDGTVFEVIKTRTGYAGGPTTLASFNQSDGLYPSNGLVADTSGNLFGTTVYGGASAIGTNYGYGTVFELAKSGGAYATTPTTLVSFNGNDGSNPYAKLILDANGNLFGTTESGGAGQGDGTVFEITKTNLGYGSTPITLANFDYYVSGSEPTGGLIADRSGNLFGTTLAGGTYGNGTVFEITGSGFVPPVSFAGLPGSANCDGVSTSTLAQAYGGIAHAAAALGYSSVASLQSAINAYCAK